MKGSSNRTSTQNTTPGGAQLTPQSVESVASKHKTDNLAMEFQIEESEGLGYGEEDEYNEEPLQHEIIFDRDEMLKQILTGIGGEIDPEKHQSLDGSMEDSDLGEEAVRATIIRMRNSGALI
jgi:hypothetical protein